MSSQTADSVGATPESSEQPEQEAVQQAQEPTAGCSGHIVVAICTGCKTERGHRVLERMIPGAVEEGSSWRGLCGVCQGVSPQNILEVHQEIPEPPLGWVHISETYPKIH